MSRYNRQLILKDFGPLAQEKLSAARVLLIGAGGLGCPVLLYLAAAGVGTLGVADGDKVELSNLHRQILYDTSDIGFLKVQVAAKKIIKMNPEVTVNAFVCNVSADTILEIIADYDIVVDATDNFASRYLISDACVLLRKPLVFGAVSGYEGQIGVFNYNPLGPKASYRDLFPIPPATGEVNTCNEDGVIGVLPGLIGTLQATEVIKIITGIGKPLINKIFTVSIDDYSSYEMEIVPQRHTDIPDTEEKLKQFNYERFCTVAREEYDEISVLEFEQVRQHQRLVILDVRDEIEIVEELEIPVLNIPLQELSTAMPTFQPDEEVIVVCASGNRSKKALQILKELLPDQKARSLRGGWKAWHTMFDELNVKKNGKEI